MNSRAAILLSAALLGCSNPAPPEPEDFFIDQDGFSGVGVQRYSVSANVGTLRIRVIQDGGVLRDFEVTDVHEFTTDLDEPGDVELELTLRRDGYAASTKTFNDTIYPVVPLHHSIARSCRDFAPLSPPGLFDCDGEVITADGVTVFGYARAEKSKVNGDARWLLDGTTLRREFAGAVSSRIEFSGGDWLVTREVVANKNEVVRENDGGLEHWTLDAGVMRDWNLIALASDNDMVGVAIIDGPISIPLGNYDSADLPIELCRLQFAENVATLGECNTVVGAPVRQEPNGGPLLIRRRPDLVYVTVLRPLPMFEWNVGVVREHEWLPLFGNPTHSRGNGLSNGVFSSSPPVQLMVVDPRAHRAANYVWLEGDGGTRWAPLP